MVWCCNGAGRGWEVSGNQPNLKNKKTDHRGKQDFLHYKWQNEVKAMGRCILPLAQKQPFILRGS